MKQTTFPVNVHLRSTDPKSLLKHVADQLTELVGVLQVSVGKGSEFRELSILVEFENPAEAKRSHSRVMVLLKRTPDLDITGIATTMTDIID